MDKKRDLAVLPSWDVIAKDQSLFDGGVYKQQLRPGAFIAGPIRDILPKPRDDKATVVVHWVALALTLPDGRESWSPYARMARGFHLHTPIRQGWGDNEQIDLGEVTLYRRGASDAPVVPVNAEGYTPEIQRLMLQCEEIGWFSGRFEVAVRQLYHYYVEKGVDRAIEISMENLRFALKMRGVEPPLIEQLRAERMRRPVSVVTPPKPIEFLGIDERDALALAELIHAKWGPEDDKHGSRFRAFANALPHALFAKPFLAAYVAVSTRPHGDHLELRDALRSLQHGAGFNAPPSA